MRNLKLGFSKILNVSQNTVHESLLLEFLHLLSRESCPSASLGLVELVDALDIHVQSLKLMNERTRNTCVHISPECIPSTFVTIAASRRGVSHKIREMRHKPTQFLLESAKPLVTRLIKEFLCRTPPQVVLQLFTSYSLWRLILSRAS